MLETLNRELGIRRLLLEEGGAVNGALLRAGLVDELSLVFSPSVDGIPGGPPSLIFMMGQVRGTRWEWR